MDQSLVAALGVAGTVFIGIITNYVAIRQSKGKLSVDERATLSTTMIALVNELQEERKEANARLRVVEVKLNDLIEHVDKLEDLLRKHNVPAPARPRWKD